MQYEIEMTDTFGGDPNYSWVRKAHILGAENATTRSLVRRAKQALGIAGRHKTSDFGDMIRVDMRDYCICLFITPAVL
jgi:hypothetical protein